MTFIRKLSAKKGTVLFVGTKRQAREIVAEEAQRAGMPYVDERWLGGMLTNFKTVKLSIKRLKDLEQMSLDGSFEKMTKKEALTARRELEKLQKSMGGPSRTCPVCRMRFSVIDVGLPQDCHHRSRQARHSGVGVVDTNHSPEGVNYVIPGNDDSSRAIRLYARGVADAILEGRSQSLTELEQTIAGDDEFVEVVEEAAE